MFDANLELCDGSADWSYANLVTSNYGTPTSTTRNSGGFAVLDLGTGAAPAGGFAVCLMLTSAANATDDALTVIIEESSVVAFGSDVHELGKFDKAAATKGIILGSEVASTTIPVILVMRVAPTRRYLRIDASCTSGDDFGTVYCAVSPFPFKYL